MKNKEYKRNDSDRTCDLYPCTFTYFPVTYSRSTYYVFTVCQVLCKVWESQGWKRRDHSTATRLLLNTSSVLDVEDLKMKLESLLSESLLSRRTTDKANQGTVYWWRLASDTWNTVTPRAIASDSYRSLLLHHLSRHSCNNAKGSGIAQVYWILALVPTNFMTLGQVLNNSIYHIGLLWRLNKLIWISWHIRNVH